MKLSDCVGLMYQGRRDYRDRATDAPYRKGTPQYWWWAVGYNLAKRDMRLARREDGVHV
jgi:hypothetical protein